AEHCTLVGVLGAGIEPVPGSKLRCTPLEDRDPLTREWLIAVVGPGIAEIIAARGLGRDDGVASEVEMVATSDRELVISVAQLLRIQCYEGIDVAQAVYEWDYSRQLLHLRAAESRGEDVEGELYSERFLVRRPLLAAIAHGDGPPPILLVDEVDRADDEFEAFLLEILSDYAVTVPELGTFRADVPPVVIITSNRTRDVHDALKRRCLYHWV